MSIAALVGEGPYPTIGGWGYGWWAVVDEEGRIDVTFEDPGVAASGATGMERAC
jgi:hypothetical protein